jgi:endonuclease YncB( thermonuclease family)
VRQGWAIAYTRYSNEYLAAQNEAEMAKRNIWSGTFMNPERWRREQN